MRAAREGGFVMVAVAVTVAMIAAALVTGWATLASVAQGNELERAQRAWLDEAGALLQAWYRRELARVDADDALPGGEALARAAGVSLRWGARLAVSERLAREGVRYRVLVVWLPQAGETPVFSAATGEFAPGPRTQWLRVSGFELQAAALGQTRTQLAQVAAALEAAARARFLADASRDAGVNRFRASDCTRVAAGEWPCVDDYAALEATPIAALAGIEPRLARNAWGAPVEVSTLRDASDRAPHTAALRTATPWGSVVSAVAVATW